MDDTVLEELAARLRSSLAMSEDSFVMNRQQLRRRIPEADEAEIGRLFRIWLQERPGAAFGDSSGRPVSWPLTER